MATLVDPIHPDTLAGKEPCAWTYEERLGVERWRAEQRGATAFADMLQRTLGSALGEPEAARVVARVDASREQRAGYVGQRAHALQHARRDVEAVIPGQRAQHAPPPEHIVASPSKEAAAEQRARRDAQEHGVRDATWWPAWARDLARRVGESKGRALCELGSVPRWAADSMRAAAKPYGGADSAPGRAVLALALVLWHVGRQTKGRISGMPRGAWTSLTLSPEGGAYSDSSVWHPYHRKTEDLLLPETITGPNGGRIGSGRNRGYMVALYLSGFARAIVPSAYGVPEWMIAPSGWPYVQVLLALEDPSGDG